MGVGVYMRELQSALEELKASDTLESAIIGPNGKVEYVTDKELFFTLKLKLPGLGERSVTVERQGESAYSVTVQPVKGAAGATLVHLVTTKDYTDTQQNAAASEELAAHLAG